MGLGGTEGVRRGAWEESFRPTRASAASRCSCRSEEADVQARRGATGVCKEREADWEPQLCSLSPLPPPLQALPPPESWFCTCGCSRSGSGEPQDWTIRVEHLEVRTDTRGRHVDRLCRQTARVSCLVGVVWGAPTVLTSFSLAMSPENRSPRLPGVSVRTAGTCPGHFLQNQQELQGPGVVLRPAPYSPWNPGCQAPLSYPLRHSPIWRPISAGLLPC